MLIWRGDRVVDRAGFENRCGGNPTAGSNPAPSAMRYGVIQTMLKDLLSKEIKTKPDTIQFAKDRKYEEAWIIKRYEKASSVEEIEQYLEDNYETLIVEYIWNSDKCDSLFVLTIFLDDTCKIKDHCTFIKKCLDFFYTYTSFLNFIHKYDSEIIGNEFLLTTEIEGVRLGVFNYWLSVGPIELWNKGEKKDLDSIILKIQSRPEVERSRLNFQGLLFTFNSSKNANGPFHGLKTPCCSKDKDTWIVDENKVRYWVNRLIK